MLASTDPSGAASTRDMLSGRRGGSRVLLPVAARPSGARPVPSGRLCPPLARAPPWRGGRARARLAHYRILLPGLIAVCSGIDPSLCRGLDDTSPYVLT